MTTETDGWIGSTSQLTYAMRIMGADKDNTGAYLVYGEAPCVGLGGEECVVSGKTLYSVNGRRFPLVGLLRQTSYGMHITVY